MLDITIAGAPYISVLLASIRIAAWLVVTPPFNNRSVPAQVKVIISLALGLLIAPQLAQQDLPTNAGQLIVMAIVQAVIGFAMGFVTYLFMTAIQQAGALIDLFGGFQLAAAFDPLSQNQNAVFGRLYEWLATMFLFISGGYLVVIGGLLKSFSYFPLSGTPEINGWADIIMRAFSMMFSVALQIALPVIAIMFLTDLVLALASKVSPTLNPIFIMQGLKIGVVLLVVGLSFSVIPGAMDKLVTLMVEAMNAIAGSEAGG